MVEIKPSSSKIVTVACAGDNVAPVLVDSVKVIVNDSLLESASSFISMAINFVPSLLKVKLAVCKVYEVEVGLIETERST